MIFVVLVLFTLVCFFVFTIHVGQRFTHKVEMQNAADAAAVSGAVWKARGFNLISVLNVSMSECLALIIMFKAFNSTMEYVDIALPINKAIATACCAIPYSAAVCCPWKAILIGYENVLVPAYDKVNEMMKKTYEGPKLLWKLMSALKKVSQAVSYATSAMSYIDASRVAKLNGADPIIEAGSMGYYAVLWPYQTQLPVEDGTFEEDLCDHTWKGGDGYKNYLCIDDAMDMEIAGIEVDTALQVAVALLSAILPPPIITYEVMKDYHYNDLCSSSGSGLDVDLTLQDSTMQCDKCKDEKGKATWAGERIELTRFQCDNQFQKGKTGTELEDIVITGGGRPSGTLLHNGRDVSKNGKTNPKNPAQPCRVCRNLQAVPPEVEGESPRYFAEIWMLKSCLFDNPDKEIEEETTDHSGDKVKPLVLVKDWKDKVKYSSLVLLKENEDDNNAFKGADGRPIYQLKSDTSGEMITYGREGDSLLKSGEVELPEFTWGLARAIVYNPGQEDLFNQNWHAKLAPLDIKGLQPEFMGFEIPIPDKLKNLANDAVEEVLAH